MKKICGYRIFWITCLIVVSIKISLSLKAEQLNGLAIQFYKEKLIPTMQEDISSEINKEMLVTLSEEELAIYVSYPCTYKDAYINSSVKLGIGPLAAWTPNEERKVSS